MKVGMRKPSIKKSISSRTTGRITRSMKSAVNPLYGKKGMGVINDPERAVKNAVYKRTTFGVMDVYDKTVGSSFESAGSVGSSYRSDPAEAPAPKWLYFVIIYANILMFVFCGLLTFIFPIAAVGLIICPIVIYRYYKKCRKDYPS